MSERAEDTISLLRHTLAQCKSIAAVMKQADAPARLAPTRSDAGQIQRQSTLVRLLSITESFCSARLVEHVEQAADLSANGLSATIWEKVAIDVTASWAS